MAIWSIFAYKAKKLFPLCNFNVCGMPISVHFPSCRTPFRLTIVTTFFYKARHSWYRCHYSHGSPSKTIHVWWAIDRMFFSCNTVNWKQGVTSGILRRLKEVYTFHLNTPNSLHWTLIVVFRWRQQIWLHNHFVIMRSE